MISATMASKEEHLNFILIPLMAPGHIIPMIDMAKLLAQRHVTTTIITTSLNVIHFSAVIDRAAASGHPIRLVPVQFPYAEAGLPEGCESADTLPSYGLISNFFKAIDMLQEPIEKMIEELKPGPSCIICDKHIAWTAETVRKFQIPRIIFDGMNCFSQLCVHNLYISNVHESLPEGQHFCVPNLPDKIELTKSQLPGMFNPGSTKLDEVRERVRVTEQEAYGVVVNSFEELEKRYIDEFRKVKGGKVWCIGPVSLCNKDNLDKAQRGSQSASIDEEKCLKWLNSWQLGTVVYACLGSLSRLSPLQFVELALGLEASNHPFVLVVKAKEKAEEIEKWIAEDGFEERTKGRSLLIRGWAPQVLILSHPAIGGFLTHCGWNSTLEGVCAGLPMITWPFFAEQFLNEKLVVQILETGVSIGAKAVLQLEVGEKSEVAVVRQDIQKAIIKVMEEDQEANERREKARELGEMAKRAMENGGSSDLNLALLIQDIKRLVSNA